MIEHSKEILLKISNLSKQYGDFHAVKDLSMEVYRGDVFTILGPNGAGKTTTIRMLMGILCPTSGTAEINGLDCFSKREEVMRLVGYLPDDPIFYDYLRGSELIRFAGEMHGLSHEQIEEKSRPLIERLDLGKVLGEFATNYSKGMKKKLALILALLHEPDLLILDEPTNGLDPYATRAVHELMLELADAGKSIFFSTHLLDQAEKLCTRVGIVCKGKLAAVGTLDELKNQSSKYNSLEDLFFSLTSEKTENHEN